ncbi:hypothetical protein Syn7502_00753 [Synechococcus sp. PCC 7502]|uniref:hypothetical protein n=1 Tax=Synechococcus sp. PCC 7502 TaxID=1173263 RepID=UPI00029FB493|nr:hypothetical protein [Synechococcus sp. PCC 7502]AFY72887.1 hypothetical protein Syn7502_00753 [Synechococcus sp. PCC 7502]
MPNTTLYLQKISAQSYQSIPILQSTGNVGVIKVITQLKRTTNLCQKAIAQERRNAYQARRNTMQNRCPV